METVTGTEDKPKHRPFPPGNNANPLGRAARRKREQAERAVVVTELVAALDHPPSAFEQIAIEAIAAEAISLRRGGQASPLLSRLLKQLGVALGASVKVTPTLEEALADIAAKGAAKRAAQATAAPVDASAAPGSADEAHASEAIHAQTVHEGEAVSERATDAIDALLGDK
jgi:hypothetical protein